jgi:hypothetical protein
MTSLELRVVNARSDCNTSMICKTESRCQVIFGIQMWVEQLGIRKMCYMRWGLQSAAFRSYIKSENPDPP